MNSEELELSLRTEFEQHLKSVRAEMKQQLAAFQSQMEGEFSKHKSQIDAAFGEFSGRFDAPGAMDDVLADTQRFPGAAWDTVISLGKRLMKA